jgi:hypothetical protein
MRETVATLLRLWLVLAFSYVLLQIAFNLLVLNRIDLRVLWFQQALFIPLGQSVVYWLITRRTDTGNQTSAAK